MSHFAKVCDGKVVNVIVAEQEYFDTFIDSSPGTWIQTSYNTHNRQHPKGTPLRGNFAGIGFTYDKDRDAFIPPKPYASWLLDEDTYSWTSPVPSPSDGLMYIWDEPSTSWSVAERIAT
tara:strand:- start:1295 stop:1651 length:357 start_codon:yes stop_codon:yes gene_type:complete